MFAVNSLQNLLLATRKTEGFPPRTARFRCRFAADAAKGRGRGGISGLRRTSGGGLETALPVAAAAAPEEDGRGDRCRRVEERDAREQRGQHRRTAIEAQDRQEGEAHAEPRGRSEYPGGGSTRQ